MINFDLGCSSKILIGCEMPYAYLGDANLFDYDFCLTHLAEENPKYLEFYKKQNESGRLIILDNSAFELGTPVSTERILKIYNQFPCPENVIAVAPDVLGKGPETIKSVEIFLLEVPEKVHVMGVVQGETWETWLECYKFLSNNPRIEVVGVSYLKIDYISSDPLSLLHRYDPSMSKTINQMWKRIRIFDELERLNLLNTLKWHHLLGMSCPTELVYQKHLSCIKTMDTSLPYVEAIHGKVFTYYGVEGEKSPRPSNYFEHPYDIEIANWSKTNILDMRGWARREVLSKYFSVEDWLHEVDAQGYERGEAEGYYRGKKEAQELLNKWVEGV